MPYCFFQGQKIYYEVYDSNHKQNLVLIEGMGFPLNFWMDFDKQLAKSFNVLTFDNRGVGNSSIPLFGYSVDEMEKDLSYVLKEVGWTQYAVLGFSLGGLIAQKHASLYPQNVTKLILASSHPGLFHAIFPKYNVFQLLAMTNKFFMDMNLPIMLDLLVATKKDSIRNPLIQKLLKMKNTSQIPAYGYHGHAIAGITFLGVDHKKIQSPVLILHGMLDKIVPSQNVDSFYLRFSHTNIESILYPDAGHLALWEKMDEVISDIHRFLDK